MFYCLTAVKNFTQKSARIAETSTKVTGVSLLFTALYGMQTRPSVENSVCLSVRLSNTWIVIKRKKNVSRFLYHTKEHLA